MEYRARLHQNGLVEVVGGSIPIKYFPSGKEIELCEQYLENGKPVIINFEVYDGMSNRYVTASLELSNETEIAVLTREELQQLKRLGGKPSDRPTVRTVLEKILERDRKRKNNAHAIMMIDRFKERLR